MLYLFNMTKEKLFIVLKFIIFVPNIFFAQNSSEDAAEYLSFEKDHAPIGSGLTRTFTLNEHYSGEIVQDCGLGKSRSFKITGEKKTSKTPASVVFRIPIEIPKGSTINISADVKTEALEGPNSGAMIRAVSYDNSSKGGVLYFSFSDTILKGTNSWTRVNLKTDSLAHTINSIELNGTMQGKGMSWFDNFKLTINGKRIDKVIMERYKPITKKEISTLKTYTLNVASPSPNSKFNKHVDSFFDILAQKEVVALGEATHGTHEIFELKHKIFKYLVEEKDFRVLALEAYLPNAFALNEYIVNDKGDPQALLAKMKFWIYYNTEFLDLIQWMHSYNLENEDKVYIAGYDMQNDLLSREIISTTFKDNPQINEHLKALDNDSLSIKIRKRLSKELITLVKKSSNDPYLVRNSEIILQRILLDTQRPTSSFKRDSLMALNIQWIKEEMFPNKKVVVWGHDEHVQKKDSRMGGFLQKFYGSKYANFGFLLKTGKYTAIDPETRHLSSLNKLKITPNTSIEYVLSKLKDSLFIFDNNLAHQNKFLQESFYKRYGSKRSIGALAVDNQFYNVANNIGRRYDFLVYIEQSKGSKILDKIQ